MKFSSMKKERTYWWVQPLLIFVITAGMASYAAFLGVDTQHDGVMFKTASDMAHGNMIFRDSFNQYGALTSIIESWFLLIFGNYLIVIKLLTAVFFGLIAVLLWFVWSLFLPELLVALSILIYIFLSPYHNIFFYFTPWSSVYSLFFQLVALYMLLKFIKSKKWGWQVGAGIATAFIFWCRQPVGAFIFGSMILYFLLLRFKKYKIPSIVPFIISYFCTHVLFFSWLIVNNALTDWYLQTIILPGRWAVSAGGGKIALLMNFIANLFPNSYSPISIWTVMPLVTLYLGYVCLKQQKLNEKYALLFLAVCVNLASWLQYHPVNDIGHQYFAASPMIGFVFYAVLCSTLDKRKVLTFLVLCFLLFVPDMLYHVRLARRKILKYWSAPTVTQPEVLKGMKVPPDEKRFYDDASNQLNIFKKTHPSYFIVTTGWDPLYSLFGGQYKNCHQLTVDWKWSVFIPQQAKEYRETTYSCIDRYKPAVFTQDKYYHPKGYVRVTKGMSQTGNYLLLPQ